jgi:hypothetical protein
MLGPADQSYDEAALYCNKLHADLFHVTNETNLEMLFSSLGVQRRAVWTGIYRSKSLSTFLDITRYPPITKTPHETIDDSQLSQDTSTAVQSVALQMVVKQLQYVAPDKDDNSNTLTICAMDIPFPQRPGKEYPELGKYKRSFCQPSKQFSDIHSRNSKTCRKKC